MAWTVVLWAALAGVAGTGLGSLWALLPGTTSPRALQALLLFTAGLMTSVVCFELVPEAVDRGGMAVTLLGIAAGVGLILLLSSLLPGQQNMLRLGTLVLLSVALHNFPEGLAIGAGFAAVPSLGKHLIWVIALHDMPEGLAMAAPMKAGGRRPWAIILLCLLSGAPTGLGAALGMAVGQVSPLWVAGSLGFSAGAMLYVACGEMLPQSFQKKGGGAALWQIVGLGAGLLASLMR